MSENAEGRATIQVSGVAMEISNPKIIQPVSADLIVEARITNGIVCISFAAVIVDGEARHKAEITYRIRLSMDSAMDLRTALDAVLKSEMPGKEMTN